MSHFKFPIVIIIPSSKMVFSLCWMILLSGAPVILPAQSGEVIDTSLRFSLVALDGKPAIRTEPALPIRMKEEDLMIRSMELWAADLVFGYSAVKKKGVKGFRIRWSIREAGQERTQLRLLPEDLRGDPVNSGILIREPTGSVVLRNALESYLDFEKEYQLDFALESVPDFDCAQPPPSFRIWPNHVIHWAAYGAGGALLTMAFINDTRAQNNYDSYLGDWKSGLDESEISFESEVDGLEKKAQTLRTVGLLIVGANTLAYIGHFIWIKKKRKKYKQFCPETEYGTQLSPYFGSDGIGMQFRF